MQKDNVALVEQRMPARYRLRVAVDLGVRADDQKGCWRSRSKVRPLGAGLTISSNAG
jgi:hypothetical protein